MRKIILTSLLLAGVLVSQPSFAKEKQSTHKHAKHKHHHKKKGG